MNTTFEGKHYPDELVSEIIQNMTAVDVFPGDLICKVGEASEHLYVLQDGILVMNFGDNTKEKEIKPDLLKWTQPYRTKSFMIESNVSNHHPQGRVK